MTFSRSRTLVGTAVVCIASLLVLAVSPEVSKTFGQCPGLVSTGLTADTSSLGISFEVTALQPIKLCKFSLGPFYRYAQFDTLEIWMHPGGLPASAPTPTNFNDTQWVKVGSITGYRLADSAYTEIPIDLSSITLASARKAGFIIYGMQPPISSWPTPLGSKKGVAPWTVSDSNLSIGSRYWAVGGRSSTTPAIWTKLTYPRQFCGSVAYSPADVAPGTLSIAVHDLNADTAIPGATVQMISGGSQSRVTGRNGTAVFSDLTAGTYSFTVTKPDYATASGQADIISGQTSVRTWFLTWTGHPPVAPVLVMPSNGSHDVASPALFAWNSVAGALRYRLQISSAEAFSSTVFDASGITSTYAIAGSDTWGTLTPYWRVSATSLGGTGAWSPVWSFTFMLPQASYRPPTLLSPACGVTGVPLPITLSWGSVTASAYHLQISTSPAFAATCFDAAGLTARSIPLTGLASNSLCFWHVGAKSDGTGWSTTWYFTTQKLSAPPAPVLSDPRDSGYVEFPLFRWHTASSAGSYRLQVSNSASFTTFIYDQPGLTDTFATVQNVPVYKWLYWRVNATNGIGTGAWSSARMVMVSPVSARPDHLSVRLKGLSIGRSIIRYDLPSATRVSVTLHDLRGRLVRKVAVGPQFAGSHQVALDPGNRLSGQFLLTFQAGNHTERRVIALIR